MKQLSTRQIRRLKFIVFIACLIPLAKLALEYCADAFPPDPVAEINHSTGIGSINLLFLTLAITPFRKLSGWQWLARFRRLLALFAFFYACLHFLSYLLFDHFFDWPEIAKDIAKRPYLIAGLAGFVLMIPLAATSTSAMMKRMGGKNWQILHRLSYVIALAVVLHYFWLVKRDITDPSIYAIILAGLFFVRMRVSSRASGTGLPIRSKISGFRAW